MDQKRYCADCQLRAQSPYSTRRDGRENLSNSSSSNSSNSSSLNSPRCDGGGWCLEQFDKNDRADVQCRWKCLLHKCSIQSCRNWLPQYLPFTARAVVDFTLWTTHREGAWRSSPSSPGTATTTRSGCRRARARCARRRTGRVCGRGGSGGALRRASRFGGPRDGRAPLPTQELSLRLEEERF